MARSLPHAPAVERAMALVCALPSAEHVARRVDVQAVLAHTVNHREFEDGVALGFENTDASAKMLLDLVLAEQKCCAQFTYALIFRRGHQPIELHVQAADSFVRPLKDMYIGLIPSRT